MEGDIPLSELQLIWDYQGNRPNAPAAKAMRILVDRDDRDYFASWGACNSEFVHSDDAGRLLQLFQKFHELALSGDLPPAALHNALLPVPEYRAAIRPEFLPDEYRDDR